MEPLNITETLVIEPRYLSVESARSSGPGGQNVNKVETKIRLRFDLRGFPGLSSAQKHRLKELAGRRIDAAGAVVLVSDESRSKSGNLESVRRRLVELVRACLKPPKARRKTRPSRGSKERRLKAKRLQSERKQSRKGGWD
ncbi:MAG: alternative ribosome rescue aminoacyl-tRNA hydrolase ArfB [Myxococcota bacterium]